MLGLLIAVACLVSKHRLWALRLQQWQLVGSVVEVPGLSCPEACGIFPDQGSNPWHLHGKEDSEPQDHQGSPKIPYFWFY